MDKLKLAAFGERLKTGGAQMSRMVSAKMKDLLQGPTPESKMVDDATSEMMEEPNWGMNMRICAMINSEEFSGPEIVKAIKKKITSKSVETQRFSLELLEACTMNCDKVFSEVASEKVLEEMIKIIDNPQTDHSNRDRAMQLIRAWGESEDLAYLPVFRQTYMSLKQRDTPLPVQATDFTPMQYSLESDVHGEPISPPARYPIPEVSVEEKQNFILVTRNSLDLLSSMLSPETNPNPEKDELITSMLNKCTESQPVIQRIIETTTDDEAMLFEALSLHDELQQVISRCEKLVDTSVSNEHQAENFVAQEVDSASHIEPQSEPHVMSGSSEEGNSKPTTDEKATEDRK